MNRRYGWKRDLPRMARPKFSVPMGVLRALPSSVDLRGQMPPVVDQGQLGSCTANAMAGLLQYDLLRQQLPAFPPSRLFQYYNERVIEGTVSSDAGASISDTISAAAKYGFADEALWPYDTSRFADAPPATVYTAALSEAIHDYATVSQTQAELCGTLAMGHPVIYGFTVYQSFESNATSQTGIVPMPKWNEQILGGHAILLVGYDVATSRYLFRNSWGDGWGLRGYGWMPFQYVLSSSLSDDFWVVNTVPGSPAPPSPPPPPPGPTPPAVLWTGTIGGKTLTLTES